MRVRTPVKTNFGPPSKAGPAKNICTESVIAECLALGLMRLIYTSENNDNPENEKKMCAT
jgi:hypothetical protein